MIVSFCPQIYDESETDQILNAKYFVWKNYTPRKWGLREAFNQDSLMQLFNGDRRIVQCFVLCETALYLCSYWVKRLCIFQYPTPIFTQQQEGRAAVSKWSMFRNLGSLFLLHIIMSSFSLICVNMSNSSMFWQLCYRIPVCLSFGIKCEICEGRG